MKKLIAISLILLIGVAFAAPELDVWYQVPWLNATGAAPYYVLNDANMDGTKDTSALVELLPGCRSISIMVDADSGASAGAIVADADSIGYFGYFIPPGQTIASGKAMTGASTDSLLKGQQCDSGATGAYHYALVHDSFFVSVAIPPPDTAGGSAALRYYYTANEADLKYPYMQFTVVVTDTTTIGNTLWIKQNSIGTATAVGIGSGLNAEHN